MSGRTYAPHDIEAILGRAALLHKRAEAPAGISEKTARATVDELGVALGLPAEHVERAFLDDREAWIRRRDWLKNLEVVPTASSFAQALAEELERSRRLKRLGCTVKHWTSDKPHQGAEAVEQFAAGLVGGKGPARVRVAGVRVFEVIEPERFFLGIRIRAARVSSVLRVQAELRDGVWHIHGQIRADDVLNALLPAIDRLSARIGAPIEVGRLELERLPPVRRV